MEIEKNSNREKNSEENREYSDDVSNSESQQSDREDYKKLKSEIKITKKKKNIGQTLEKLLKKKTSKFINYNFYQSIIIFRNWRSYFNQEKIYFQKTWWGENAPEANQREEKVEGDRK